jgi:site-specific recombinase XerD
VRNKLKREQNPKMLHLDRAIEIFRGVLLGERRSDRTIREYVRIVRATARELGGLTDPPDVMRPRLVSWRERLGTKYERDEIKESKVQNDVYALQRFYRILVEHGAYPESPADALVTVKRRRTLPRPMPMTDVDRLFASCDVTDRDGLRDRTILELLLHGLRRIEVTRLTTAHVEYVARESTLALRVHGKGDTEAVVVLHPASARYLAEHLLAEYAPKDFILADESELVACGRLLSRRLQQEFPCFRVEARGVRRAITVEDVNRIFRKHRKAADLGDSWGPHSLRHTCGTELVEAGVNLRVVQEILRHVNVTTTEIYTKVTKGAKASAASKLPTPAAREPLLPSRRTHERSVE